jgi:hypothetical protein
MRLSPQNFPYQTFGNDNIFISVPSSLSATVSVDRHSLQFGHI